MVSSTSELDVDGRQSSARTSYTAGNADNTLNRLLSALERKYEKHDYYKTSLGYYRVPLRGDTKNIETSTNCPVRNRLNWLAAVLLVLLSVRMRRKQSSTTGLRERKTCTCLEIDVCITAVNFS